MKKTNNKNRLSHLLIILLASLLVFSCKKDKDKPIPVPDPVLESSYDGTLVVQFINTIPPWNETSIGMEVFIDGEFGVVDIADGSLAYTGDTIINNDSRIERTGFWNMYPLGSLRTEGGIDYLDVNAQIIVVGDVQHVYAKDNNDNWVLVSTFNFTGSPNSDLAFVLQDAINTSSVVSASTGTGSITWTLSLIERP